MSVKGTMVYVSDITAFDSEDQFSDFVFSTTNIRPKLVTFAKDRSTGQREGYGFLEINSSEQAALVIQKMNDIPIPNRPGKKFRLKFGSSVDSNVAGLAAGYKVYVGNLPPTVTDEQLLDFFKEQYGDQVVSAQIHRNSEGYSKCFGFVKFSSVQAMQDSITRLTGVIAFGRPLKVNEAVHNRVLTEPSGVSNVLFLSNIDNRTVTIRIIHDAFSFHGTVLSATFSNRPDWAYVVMSTFQQAEKAKNALNNSHFGGATPVSIQYGRTIDEAAQLQASKMITVPTMKLPKSNKNQILEFSQDPTQIDEVIRIMDRHALAQYQPLGFTDPHVVNHVSAQKFLRLYPMYQWGEQHFPKGPPPSLFWFY